MTSTRTQIATPDIQQLNRLGPEALLEWAASRFGDRAGLVTSFQLTGCVMIDMAHRVAPALRVITIDTLRLHPETYALMDTLEKRYGIQIERFSPDPDRLRTMIERHGEYLFFDSKAKQEYCCKVRKVEPNARVLHTLDVWITGLRRDQSKSRETVEKASLAAHNGRNLIKLCPLAEWSEREIREYIERHNVPYNALYDQGYESIGCAVCSTPTLPWEHKRAGRWRWFNHLGKDQTKECGIHNNGSGI